MKTRIKATDHKLTKKQRESLMTSSKETLTEKHGWEKKAINRETGQKTETMIIDKEDPLTVTKADHLAFNIVRVTERVFTKDHPNRIHPLTGEPIKKGDPVITRGPVAVDSEDLEGFLEEHEKRALHSPKRTTTREISVVESKTLTSEKPLGIQRLEEEERRRKEVEKLNEEDVKEAQRIQKILNQEKARRQKEKEDGYTPEEREAIKLAIMERYPGLDEKEFDFAKGLSGMVDIRFRESNRFSTNGIWEEKLLEEGKELKEEKREPRLVEATIDDIDAEKASSAYHGTSMSPEQRGLSVRRDYAVHVNNFYDELYSQVPEEQRDELVAEMVKYKEFYKSGTEEQLHRHSGLASSFISGPAKFPVRQQQKKGDIYDRKRNEFSVKDAKVQRAIKKRLGLIKPRGISSDNPEAVQLIDTKIDDLEENHAKMKASNKIIRSKKTTDEEKKKQLKELGNNDSVISNLMNEGENYSNWEGRGWASFHLSSNTAEIRRLKKRKEQLEKQRSDTTSTKTVNGVEIEDNVEDNRLRIHFDEKPDPETIRDLKSSGFRWSPRNSAWQRYRSSAANYEAERITKKYAERKNNKST